MNKKLEQVFSVIGTLLGLVFAAFIFIALFTYPTMWMWNWLMPDIFGLPELTFWQTFGLMVLGRFIFPTINYKSNSK